MVSPVGLGMTLLTGGEVGRPTWLELYELLTDLVIFRRGADPPV